MPMNFEIVTDSSCNLVEDMIDEFGLHIPVSYTHLTLPTICSV